jgi:flagellar protein FliS
MVHFMSDPRDIYLETQIATATPQKLRLMLIEGAIRFAHQADTALQDEQWDALLDSVSRCREIISELIAGIRVDESPLARQVAGIYAFLFRTVTEAQMHRDRQRFAEVLRVLEEERQTWLELCQQMPDRPDPALRQQYEPKEITAPLFASAPAAEAFSIDA